MTRPELQVSREGRVGFIRLDRPQALNSLTLGMVRGLARALDDFGDDPDIAAVVISGSGGRAFCAGGDLRALFERRHDDPDLYKIFWREEYAIDSWIARFPKPYVAVMDGIVMGAGVGLSAHGNCRIVTERTRLAMPETRIGFIPDVGATWLLTREGGAGTYMALSGDAVGGADAIRLGLADLLVDSDRIPELMAALSRVRRAEEVESMVAGFARPPGEAPLARHEALLDAAMTGDTVEAVLEALARDASSFARHAASEIAARSPTSLKLTLALLKRARTAPSVETCLTNEFRAACALLATHDLYEGVRAAIIDKDRRPRWAPATLGQVDEAVIARLLAGTGAAEPDYR